MTYLHVMNRAALGVWVRWIDGKRIRASLARVRRSDGRTNCCELLSDQLFVYHVPSLILGHALRAARILLNPRFGPR
jgi:hypothetical protein